MVNGNGLMNKQEMLVNNEKKRKTNDNIMLSEDPRKHLKQSDGPNDELQSKTKVEKASNSLIKEEGNIPKIKLDKSVKPKVEYNEDGLENGSKKYNYEVQYTNNEQRECKPEFQPKDHDVEHKWNHQNTLVW